MAKAAFNRKKMLFTRKLDANLRKKLAQHCMVVKLGHFRNVHQKYLESYER